MRRFTCEGSQRPPDGEPALLSGRKLPAGICSVCGQVLKMRADGRISTHRGVPEWPAA